MSTASCPNALFATSLWRPLRCNWSRTTTWCRGTSSPRTTIYLSTGTSGASWSSASGAGCTSPRSCPLVCRWRRGLGPSSSGQSSRRCGRPDFAPSAISTTLGRRRRGPLLRPRRRRPRGAARRCRCSRRLASRSPPTKGLPSARPPCPCWAMSSTPAGASSSCPQPASTASSTLPAASATTLPTIAAGFPLAACAGSVAWRSPPFSPSPSPATACALYTPRSGAGGGRRDAHFDAQGLRDL